MSSRKRWTIAWSMGCGVALAVLALEQALAGEAYDWSGGYFGGHVAYSRGTTSNTLSTPNPVDATNSFGAVYGGVQVGYNHLLSSRWLLGVEADITFPNHLEANQRISTRPLMQSEVFEQVDFIGTLRGRLGYAFDRWMIYGTGGLAWSRARLIEMPGPVNDEDKALRWRAGWALGAGAEMAVAPNWTARLEYLYTDLGRVSATFPSGTGYSSDFDIHAVRVGLNRKIGEPGSGAGVAPAFGPFAPGNWNIHSQFTVIGQGYRPFRSPYQGENSLSSDKQFRNTVTATAFVGFRPWDGGEIYLNPELMQGYGLSDVRGVAGFPNGEAQKSNFPSGRFNMARMFVRHTFGLGGEQEAIEDAPNQLAGKQDISRVSVTVGKFAVPDYFNLNSFAGEPRTGFLNWNMYGGGSYDWTMDRLSWTWGGMIDFNQKHWAFRTGYFLLPVQSNVDNFDMNIPRRGQYVAEWELRYAVLSQPGKFRFFTWLSHGTMGNYLDAVALPPTSLNYPDIALTRQTRTNYGLVANFEQSVTDDLGLFSRATWSPGHMEMLGWTDVHNSVSAGGVLKGRAWGRPNDKIGIAGVTQGLSSDGRAYFAAGGLGILIGDGQLNYRRENVFETYYAYSVNTWLTTTLDYQLIANPGYNADRGPASVFAVRVHGEW